MAEEPLIIEHYVPLFWTPWFLIVEREGLETGCNDNKERPNA